MLESMINRRVVLAGGPSTGKTSVLNKLKKLGFKCYDSQQEKFYQSMKRRDQALD